MQRPSGAYIRPNITITIANLNQRQPSIPTKKLRGEGGRTDYPDSEFVRLALLGLPFLFFSSSDPFGYVPPPVVAEETGEEVVPSPNEAYFIELISALRLD